jgi:putative transcription factor
MSDFQDLKPVNIGHGNKAKTTAKVHPEPQSHNNTASNIVKAASIIVDDDMIKTEKVDPEFSKMIIQARLAKKMTQAQLAHALSLDVTIVKDYENGSAKKNGPITSKIKKYLNINKNTV